MKVNTANAVTGVTAKMRSGANRTSAMTVNIKAPGHLLTQLIHMQKPKHISLVNLDNMRYSTVLRIQTNHIEQQQRRLRSR